MKNKIVKLIVIVSCVISCSFSVVALFSGCSENNYKFLVINALKKENIIKSNWVLEDEYSESWNWNSSMFYYVYKDENENENLIVVTPNNRQDSIEDKYGYDLYYAASLLTEINYDKYAKKDGDKIVWTDSTKKHSYLLLCNDIHKIEKVVENY